MCIYTKKYPPGYYVYMYLRSRDSNTVSNGKIGTPYYVGKGCKYRAWEKHQNVRVPKDISNIIIIAQELTEEAAFRIEQVQIAIWGRVNNSTGVLRNKTEGGEGSSGFRHTDETKQKMSEQRKGRIPWNKGGTMPEHVRNQLASVNKGKTLTEEHKEKLRQKFKGKTRSIEVRQKIKAGLLRSLATTKRKPRPPRGKEFRLQCSKKVKGSHYWNNGIEMKRAVECPGDGFVRGRLDTGAKYWNNGSVMKKSNTCPGDGWQLGMLKNGGRYWNNGQIMKKSVSCPGEGWCLGRLQHTRRSV